MIPSTRQAPAAADYALLFLLGAIWGASFVFIKIAVEEIPPLTVTGVRLGLAAVLLAGAGMLAGQRWPRGWATWRLIALAALFGNVLPFTLITWGEEVIHSSTAAILMGGMPLLTIVIAHWVTEDERINAPKVAGVLLGLAGLLVLVGPTALAGLSEDLVRQLALVLAAACYAVNAVLTRRLMGLRRRILAASVISAAAAFVIPASLVLEAPLQVHAGWQSWGAVAMLGVAQTAIATLLMFAIIKRQGAGFFSQINLLVPLSGVVWSALILAERPGFNALAALGLILAGILVTRAGSGLTRSAVPAK